MFFLRNGDLARKSKKILTKNLNHYKIEKIPEPLDFPSLFFFFLPFSPLPCTSSFPSSFSCPNPRPFFLLVALEPSSIR